MLAAYLCLVSAAGCASCERDETARHEYAGWQRTVDPERDELPMTKTMLEVLEVGPGMKVADIGAGYGYYSFRFADLVGEEGRVFATDTDEEMIEIMTRHRDENGVDNVEVIKVRRDEHGLDHLGPGSLDRIALIHSVDLQPDEPASRDYLSRLRELLRPEGYLVYMFNRVDEEEIKKLFLDAGFDRVESHPCPDPLPDEMYRELYPEDYEAGLPFGVILEVHK